MQMWKQKQVQKIELIDQIEKLANMRSIIHKGHRNDRTIEISHIKSKIKFRILYIERQHINC